MSCRRHRGGYLPSATLVLALLAGTLGVGPSWALSPDDVLLYLPFDGSVEPQVAAGPREMEARGTVEYAEGKWGQGYLSGRQGDELLYRTEGNFNLDGGTVSVWLKPVNLSDYDLWFRVWFRMGEAAGAGGQGTGNFLWLYKYTCIASNTPNLVPLYWLVQRDYLLRETTCVSGGSLRQGEWLHAAATWCGPVMRLYVNGRYQGYSRAPTPRLLRNLDYWMYVGGESWLTSGERAAQPDTVVDEFHLLRRPLTAAEVQTLYEQGPAAFTATEAQPHPADLELQVDYLPSGDTLRLGTMISGRLPGEVGDLQAHLQITPVDQPQAAALEQPLPLTELNQEHAVPVAKLPPGQYRLAVTLTVGGQAGAPVTAEFEKPQRPAWLGNRLGISPRPPEPWTPLQRQGDAVSCWGREVTWGSSLFPTQMTSQGRPLLAGPVELLAERGGQSLPLRDARLRWGEVSPTRAEFSVEARLGDLPVSAAGWMEYDGLVWTEVKLSPVAGGSLDRLALRIPLRPEAATLQTGNVGKPGQPGSGLVRAWQLPLAGPPFLWLGNEEVGLQWSTGDNYCWENADPASALQLAPGEQACVLTLTLVDHQIPLDRELAYSFGLQATPVRPLPRDWRSYELHMNGSWRKYFDRGAPTVAPWPAMCMMWSTQNEVGRGFRCETGYPVPGPWAREAVEAITADGAKPFLYWIPSWIWRGAPEYPAFHSEWNPGSRTALPFEEAPSNGVGIWRTVPSFRDWAVWRIWKTLYDSPWLAEAAGGFYLDVVQGGWGPDPRPDREGLTRVRHELLGSRVLQQRLYTMLQDKWPDLRLINHQSGDMIMSQLGFSYVYLTGENYRGQADVSRDGNYYKTLPLEVCKAELLPAKWGVPIFFLPEIGSSSADPLRCYRPDGIPASEHLAGLLLIHDTIVYNAYIHPLPMWRLAALRENFGWDEQTEFVGYWKSEPYVGLQADQSPVVVGVFRRPGKVMFAVMNNSDQDAQVVLTPNWAACGVAEPAQVTDAYTATGLPTAPLDLDLLGSVGQVRFLEPKQPLETVTFPVAGGQIRCMVPKRNFRALVAE